MNAEYAPGGSSRNRTTTPPCKITVRSTFLKQRLMTDGISQNGESPPHAKGLLLYCRAGFESECAQEIAAFATARDLHGHVRAQRDSAVVEYVLAEPVSALALTRSA